MKIPNIISRFTSLPLKKQIIYGSLLAIIVLIPLFIVVTQKTVASTDLYVTPAYGEFIVTITTTGELQAKNSIEINGPEEARAAQIWQLKITNLIAEGTVVKKGEFVADLDKSEITNKLKDAELSVQKLDAQYTQAKLDSTLVLSQARDEMVNMYYTLEEKKIIVDQSSFEAPAVKRQAQIDYDRTERTLTQAKNNYVIKTQQSIAKIQAVEADLMKERQKMSVMLATLQKFTILAPAYGMVIYAREWNGKKKVVGSTVAAWEPTVATLPDLTTMESITYINEVDIQKIAKGQTVTLHLDADPNKKLVGTVTNVANIGEQRPNSDSKVFEVRILISDRDTTLRPAMTTANEILVAKASNVLSIPLETVHAEGQTIFVFVKRSGIIKQEVKLGLQNDNAAIVLEGVNSKDEILLSPPQSAATLKLKPLKASL